MRIGISILAIISVLLQLSAAGKNFKTVESAIVDSEKKRGKSKKGDIYVFKEWWAPKPGNQEDIRRDYSHVRTIVVQVTDANPKSPKLKGRAFDVGYYKVDEHGYEQPLTAADQVIDANGYPASRLLMAKSDETWYANRYKKNNKLVEISQKNSYELVARNPSHFKNIEEIYDALRKRGDLFLERERGNLWVRDYNSCTTYCTDLISNVILPNLDELSPQAESSRHPDQSYYKASPQAGASSYSGERAESSEVITSYDYGDGYGSDDQLAGP